MLCIKKTNKIVMSVSPKWIKAYGSHRTVLHYIVYRPFTYIDKTFEKFWRTTTGQKLKHVHTDSSVFIFRFIPHQFVSPSSVLNQSLSCCHRNQSSYVLLRGVFIAHKRELAKLIRMWEYQSSQIDGGFSKIPADSVIATERGRRKKNSMEKKIERSW